MKIFPSHLFSGECTRSDLERVARAEVEKGRTWIQNHGELSAVGGFIIGIVVITFFWIFFCLLILTASAGGIVWLAAKH